MSLSSCGLHGNALDSLLDDSNKSQSSARNIVSIVSSSSRVPYSGNYEKVDIDLTAYSDTMAYSEALNIAENYEENRGKTMKVKGVFKAYESTTEGVYFYACSVSDTTGCCSLYFEFIPRKEMTYPDDFPEEDAPISVAGVFDPYTEFNEGDGKTYIYCNLADAEMF